MTKTTASSFRLDGHKYAVNPHREERHRLQIGKKNEEWFLNTIIMLLRNKLVVAIHLLKLMCVNLTWLLNKEINISHSQLTLVALLQLQS